MLRTLRTILFVAATITVSLTSYAATDLKDMLKAVSKSAGSDTAAASTSGKSLGALGNAIAAFTASSRFEINDLIGSWVYNGPAVTFRSDNALQKIGGTAAASTIETKLQPFYNRAGLTDLHLTVAEDSSFTFKVKKVVLKGKLSRDEDGNLQFNFNAFGKVKLGRMNAYATKSGSTLNLTFDVSRLISIVKAVSSVSGAASLNAITSLLQSYDGIYAGFRLKAAGE